MRTVSMLSKLWRCRSMLLLPLLLTLLVSACATNSPPLASLPERRLQIPPAPVTLGPQHTRRYWDEARSFSESVEAWLTSAQALTQTEQRK